MHIMRETVVRDDGRGQKTVYGGAEGQRDGYKEVLSQRFCDLLQQVSIIAVKSYPIFTAIHPSKQPN